MIHWVPKSNDPITLLILETLAHEAKPASASSTVHQPHDTRVPTQQRLFLSPPRRHSPTVKSSPRPSLSLSLHKENLRTESHAAAAAQRGERSHGQEGRLEAEEEEGLDLVSGRRCRGSRRGRRPAAAAKGAGGRRRRRRRVFLLLPAPVPVPTQQEPHLHRFHGEPAPADPAAQRRDRQRRVADPPGPAVGDGALHLRLPLQRRRAPGTPCPCSCLAAPCTDWDLRARKIPLSPCFIASACAV